MFLSAGGNEYDAYDYCSQGMTENALDRDVQEGTHVFIENCVLSRGGNIIVYL